MEIKRGYYGGRPAITCTCGACKTCVHREYMRTARARLDGEFTRETERLRAEADWFGPPRSIPSSLGFGEVHIALNGRAKGAAA